MTLDLRTTVREAWEAALDAERIVRVPAFIDTFIEEHEDDVESEGARLIRQALIRWVKDIARGEAEGAEQLSLFGFPGTIAIPTDAEDDEGEYAYIRSTKATFGELDSGKAVRVSNVQRAQARLDVYVIALERVRPLMEGTSKTLAEALAEQGGAA